MRTQYENQNGLLVIPGTNQCAGYIFNFEGHGGYDPTGKVETFWVWFTGPDGKQWYGVNKGDQQCFTGRRLKIQPKKG